MLYFSTLVFVFPWFESVQHRQTTPNLYKVPKFSKRNVSKYFKRKTKFIELLNFELLNYSKFIEARNTLISVYKVEYIGRQNNYTSLNY